MAAGGSLLGRTWRGLLSKPSPAWSGVLQQIREIHGTGRKKRPGGGG
jgi:hypothetical protein